MLKELGRLLTSQTSRQAAKAALPGAALNFAVGTMAGGPAAGAAYAVGGFLLDYPLVGATRKMFPGTPGGMATIKGKDGVVTKREIPYSPSSVETGVNLIASLASMPLVDYVTQGALYQQQQQLQPAQQSQERQINQQVAQRQRVNNLINAQTLSPGTQFQDFHYPGITLPPETLELLQSMQ